MTSETIRLNLIPGGDLPVLHSSQFDTGRALTFEIYDGEELFTSFDAYDISLHARKVDGNIIGIDTYNVDSENHQVIFFTTEQLTACAGKNICELVFTDPISGTVVGSCNFWLEVEGDPYSGGIDSASDIENLSTQIAAIVDSQLDNYYTKEEIDDQIETIVTEQVTPIVSGIVAEQVPPAIQAELGNYYTKAETDSAFYDKSEVDILLSGKADTSDLPDMDNYYDKDTTDTLLASKANTSTTYTKTEVDNLIAAIPSNDITTEITTPAYVQTFNDGGDNIPLKSLVTEILPIQSGSGVPSPSNVRAISGHSNCTITRYARNVYPILISDDLFDDAYSATHTSSGGVITITCSSTNNSGIYATMSSVIRKMPTTLNGTYTYSLYVKADLSGKNMLIGFSQAGQETVVSSTSWQRVEITTTFSNADKGAFNIRNTSGVALSIQVKDLQVESGSYATTYDEPQITTIPLGQTVYGGSLECVNGEGQVNYGYIEFDGSSDEDWSYETGNKWATITISDMMSGANQNGITNWLPKATSYGNFGFALGRNNNNFYAYQIPDISGVTDLASWKTYLSNNPLQVVYPLATPTSLSVSGANIPTLSGENNIYTDVGDIQSLEYFNNKADDIAAMISLMTRS